MRTMLGVAHGRSVMQARAELAERMGHDPEAEMAAIDRQFAIYRDSVTEQDAGRGPRAQGPPTGTHNVTMAEWIAGL
mgnify:FL=1